MISYPPAHLEHIINGFPDYEGLRFNLTQSHPQPGAQHKSPGLGWTLPSADETAAFLIAQGGYSQGIIATRTICAYSRKDGLTCIAFADNTNQEGGIFSLIPKRFFDPTANGYYIPAGEPILDRIMSVAPPPRHVTIGRYMEVLECSTGDLEKISSRRKKDSTSDQMIHVILKDMAGPFARFAHSFEKKKTTGASPLTINLESPDSFTDLHDGDTLVYQVKLETSVEQIDMWRKKPSFAIWANRTEGDRCLWVKRE